MQQRNFLSAEGIPNKEFDICQTILYACFSRLFNTGISISRHLMHSYFISNRFTRAYLQSDRQVVISWSFRCDR